MVNFSISQKEEYEIKMAKTELEIELSETQLKKGKNYKVDDYLEHLEENDIKTTKTNEGNIYAEIDNRIFEVIIENDKITDLEYKDKGIITAPSINKITVIEITEKNVTIQVTGTRMEDGTYYYYIMENENDTTQPVGNNTTRFFYI